MNRDGVRAAAVQHMLSLTFYANESDASEFVTFLFDLNELALLVSTGEGSWKAVRCMPASELFGKRVCFWHIPSGPLPLVGLGGTKGIIQDPWSGWKELRKTNDSQLPWFGPAYNGVFLMNLYPRSRFTPDDPARHKRALGRSDFGWHKHAGIKPVPKATAACWKKLEDYLLTKGKPLDPLGWSEYCPNPTPDRVKDDYNYIALPGALVEMQTGTPWMPSPELDAVAHSVVLPRAR